MVPLWRPVQRSPSAACEDTWSRPTPEKTQNVAGGWMNRLFCLPDSSHGSHHYISTSHWNLTATADTDSVSIPVTSRFIPVHRQVCRLLSSLADSLNETHRYLKKTLQLSLDLNFGTTSVHCSTEDIWKVFWCRNLKSFIFKLKLWCDKSHDDNIRCLRKGIRIHSSSNDLL